MLRKAVVLAVVVGLGTCGLGATSYAGGKGGALKVGDKAPAFEAKDDEGKLWKSTDHVGKKILVIYFYPADFTGGCTKQACSYRDDLEKLSGKNVKVIGVSGDTVETHQKFKKHHKLNFTLLADVKGEVAKALGVPVNVAEKKLTVTVDDLKIDITRPATSQRWTIVIDQKGNIAYINSKVNAAEDSKNILEVVNKLESK
jgi:peroxiredoxin Q/BCP